MNLPEVTMNNALPNSNLTAYGKATEAAGSPRSEVRSHEV